MQQYRFLGAASAVIIILSTSMSVALHCTRAACAVSVASLLLGLFAGGMLAAITRTRNPFAIYALIALAALTLWPIFELWPPADSEDIVAWKGAPSLVYNYFDFLRLGVYLVAIPYPFARFGIHAPDKIASGPENP